MRIKKTITKEKMPRSFILFSQLILKGNVWRSVWRICMCTKSCLTLQLESPLKANTPPPPHLFFFGFDIFMNYAKIRQFTLGATDITFLSLPLWVIVYVTSYTWRDMTVFNWYLLGKGMADCLFKILVVRYVRFTAVLNDRLRRINWKLITD